jgi:hypothetical protein
VAVPAVDPVAGDVSFVTELDRLLPRGIRAGDPRRAAHGFEETNESGDDKDGAENADASDRVSAAMKDLRHR